MKKQLILIGHLSLIVTLILAIYFYLERTLYVDSGLQIFDIVNKNKFSIILSRYSLIITQILPWLAFKAGLPLKYIMLSYSLSFIIVYYICYLICVYGLKNIPAGLTIALAPLLIRFSFGASICESWTGLVYSALFYAFLNHYSSWKGKGYPRHIAYYLILAFIIALNYFIHPSTLFTLLFAIVFSFLYQKNYTSPHYYIAGVLISVMYSYKFFFPDDNYESSFFDGIKMADQLLFKFYTLPICDFIQFYFKSHYIVIPIIFILGIYLFLRQRKIPAFLFSILFIFVYVVIASLAFYKGDAHFLIESRLIPVAFMTTIPFIEIILKSKRTVLYSGAIIALISFSYIQLVKKVNYEQTPRITAYKYYLNKAGQYPERKFYVYIPEDKTTVFNSWGSSHETLMLSSLDNNKNSKTVTFVYKSQKVEDLWGFYPCLFLGVSWQIIVNEDLLNKKYFDLQCSKYRELEYEEKVY